MPTREEREYYAKGFQDGARWFEENLPEAKLMTPQRGLSTVRGSKKRKLSAWNKYVKNKRNHITYRDGKLNLKKMAVAFRRKKRR
jgi:hypothetical protein